ncbi:MAG: prolyl oligopeptidase family serine peptidase [Planctomycetota bacterium]
MKTLIARTCGAVIAASLVAAPLAVAQESSGYRLPPKEIVDLLDAPPTPSVSVSPTGDTMILVHRESLPPISEMAKPMERLAGLRLDPMTNGRHGPRSYVGLSLKELPDGEDREVRLPNDADVGFPRWSPDGEKFAFTITSDRGIQLWVGETDSGRARSVTGWEVNEAAGGFSWLGDSRTIIARLVPNGRGSMPEESRIPEGPVTQENAGKTSPVRTYQDLLEDEHDEAMFDWLMTSQIVSIDTDRRRTKKIGDPAVYGSVSASPDGKYLLVDRVNKPYSYLVTYRSFPETTEVWTMGGKMVTEIADKGLRDNIPIGGVETGRRSIGWQSNAPATLVWAEALDGGDPKAEVPERDRVMMLSAPFDGRPTEVVRLEDRYSGAQWVGKGELAMVSEYDRDARWSRTWLMDFERPGSQPKLVFERNTQDRYADPGSPVTMLNEFGRSVAHVHNDSVFLTGRGATPQGDRPFMHRMSLRTFEKEEMWRNAGENYESIVDLLEPDGTRVLTSYQTPTVPPNYYIRDLGAKTRVAVTEFEDPQPQLRGITKELVRYKRADGVDLNATLYLPADYERGQRLPLIVWAYPREFNDARTASQISGSPYRFTRIGGYSHLFFLTQGYAIMDAAAMPVIGNDPETVNDSFIDQIVAAGQAAIDYAVERGVADRDRVAVGGHSYGAFMTANLLAHSDIFRAGIARSGAYNRTLTPFGFQSERRTFWEAPDVYFNLSPFMHANQINEPILLIHGQQDNNSGTFPIQSERLYHAVKGHGGTVRLVMLPYESHGYRARESIMHTLAEQVDWLEKHVKYADTPRESSGVGAGLN